MAAGASYGGNAIIGVSISNFSSSIGGAFGDAVGIALLGTVAMIGTA